MVYSKLIYLGVSLGFFIVSGIALKVLFDIRNDNRAHHKAVIERMDKCPKE